MKKAFLIAAMLVAISHPAQADVASCMQANEYERLALKRINFANELAALAQSKYDSNGAPMTDARRSELKNGIQEEKNAAVGWMVKQNQAQAQCN
jgi:hypothetical protein